jgi:hypothetical protein
MIRYGEEEEDGQFWICHNNQNRRVFLSKTGSSGSASVKIKIGESSSSSFIVEKIHTVSKGSVVYGSFLLISSVSRGYMILIFEGKIYSSLEQILGEVLEISISPNSKIRLSEDI